MTPLLLASLFLALGLYLHAIVQTPNRAAVVSCTKKISDPPPHVASMGDIQVRGIEHFLFPCLTPVPEDIFFSLPTFLPYWKSAGLEEIC